jgi:uridine kinase
MARWAPEKKDTMEALATEILHHYGRGRAIIAVDGRRASGMHEFGDDLATALAGGERAVFHASIEDFQRPRSERQRGLYTDGYDYSLLRRVLIDPFRTAGSTGFALTGFDAERDEPVYQPKWKSAGHDAVLIVSGVYLNRPELSSVWNYSVWLEDPSTEDEFDAAYLTEIPSGRATSIYDNSDPGHPRRIFADSC